MEAIMLGSRSVVQDQFFEKDQTDRLKKHTDSVKLIGREKLQSLKGYEKEI